MVWMTAGCVVRRSMRPAYHLISRFSVGSDALESGERERSFMGRYITDSGWKNLGEVGYSVGQLEFVE
jgi:hypothetical protein